MKKLIIILTCIAGLAAGCNDDEFTVYSSGLSYKIISHKQSGPVHPGETLKMHIRQMYNDSVLSDTRDSVPFYQVYDSTVLSPESYEIFGKLRKGDSAIFKVPADSAFKNKRPDFVKGHGYLFTHLKVVEILGVKEDFRTDLQREIDKKKATN